MNNGILPIYQNTEKSVLCRINEVRSDFIAKTGEEPTKIFISCELIEELLIEMLPAISSLKHIRKDPKLKNKIYDMDAFRVVERDVIAVSI